MARPISVSRFGEYRLSGRPPEAANGQADTLRFPAPDAGRSLRDLGYLFKAEHERVAGKCVERRDRFLALKRESFRSDFSENATGRVREVFQESERVTSPLPSSKIGRGDRKSLCANVFAHPGHEIIFALGLADAIPAAREEFHQAIAASHDLRGAALHARNEGVQPVRHEGAPSRPGLTHGALCV